MVNLRVRICGQRCYSSLSQYKTALITGGSKGIGLSIARTLNLNGYRCLLMARNEELLRSNVEELNSQSPFGIEHDFITYDLASSVTGVESLKALLYQYFGKKEDSSRGSGIDVLINCAGATQNTMVPFTSVEKIQEIVSVNLISSIVLSKLITRKWLTMKRPGQIVNISSVLALPEYNEIKGTAVYSLTKLALVTFTEKLNQELRSRKIYSNVVLPSLIRDTGIGQSVNLQEFEKHNITHITSDQVAELVLDILEKNENGQVVRI